MLQNPSLLATALATRCQQLFARALIKQVLHFQKRLPGHTPLQGPTRPSGIDYVVFVQWQAANSTAAVYIFNVNVASSTSFVVWSKTTAYVLTDSNVYVYTMP